MGIISESINIAFRDFSVSTVPASGAHEPIKSEIRAIGAPIEAQIAAAALSGTDLDAAMVLVAPLLTSAQAAQAAANSSLLVSQGVLATAQNIATSVPYYVTQQLAGAVANATAQSGSYAAQADASRQQAQLAAASSFTNARYYTSRAAGVAATVAGQLFATKDGGNNLVYYENTGGGASTLVNPGPYATLDGVQTLTSKTFSGGTAFALNGSRMGITDTGVAIVPSASVEFRGTGVSTCGLRVSQRWTGSTAVPYQNNDVTLFECFNNVTSDSLNLSWSVSAPNAYNNIPAGVRDAGERLGVYGWATTVNIPGQYVHAGTLASQIGVRGRAGFQGPGTPATAVIESAVGVQGEIYAESAGATIQNAVAGRFTSIDPTSTILNNTAIFANARGGQETNFSFFSDAGMMLNTDKAIFGPTTTYTQSPCCVSVRGANGVEFGNGDPAGYGSNLGATTASGYPFLAFNAEASGGNTYRTRGKPGRVIWADMLGSLVFSRVTNPNADGQGLTDDAFFDATGKLRLQETLTLRSRTPASATDSGQEGEFCWDENYLYLCVADDTWKRVAVAAW